jgi:uncharacterized YigZ family protein
VQRFISFDETLFLFYIMSQRYPIPADTVRTELVVKRSRFIATISSAGTVDAARNFIQQIRDEMPDASHHVYAFRVGYGSSVIEGLSDDGEPSGTSGKPVMAVLRGSNLGDAVIVITRYFGGTKLGTGGLVRAYSGAAKEAVAIVPRAEKIFQALLEATIPYQTYEHVKRTITDHEGHLLDERFSQNITLRFSVPEEYITQISERLQGYTVGNCIPTFLSSSA